MIANTPIFPLLSIHNVLRRSQRAAIARVAIITYYLVNLQTAAALLCCQSLVTVTTPGMPEYGITTNLLESFGQMLAAWDA